ncbi:MAG: hypothetical protein ACRKGH_05965 [Dehalogenimonas sp.]
MRITYVLYGFGILLSLAGVGFLAAEYMRFMSEAGKLAALILTVAMFAALTRYFEEVGY